MIYDLSIFPFVFQLLKCFALKLQNRVSKVTEARRDQKAIEDWVLPVRKESQEKKVQWVLKAETVMGLHWVRKALNLK